MKGLNTMLMMIFNKLRWLIMSFIIVTASACTSHQVSVNQVNITEDLSFQLLSPESFGQSILLTQQAEFQFGDNTLELLMASEITPEKIVVVGLTPGGTTLFSIVFDGLTVQVEGANAITQKVQPYYLLADLQLTLWPLDTLNKELKKTDSCFLTGVCQLTQSDDQMQRTLLYNKLRVISISYKGLPHYKNNVQFKHHRRQYQLEISTLSVEHL